MLEAISYFLNTQHSQILRYIRDRTADVSQIIVLIVLIVLTSVSSQSLIVHQIDSMLDVSIRD